MDRKGFVRTLEAVIAIIIIFVFIYVMSQRGLEKEDKGIESIKSLQEEILRGISENTDYRDCIVGLTLTELNVDLKRSGYCRDVLYYVESNLGRFSRNYALFACVSGSCGIPDNLPDKNVYTSAIVITSSLESNGVAYSPRIVRLWIW